MNTQGFLMCLPCYCISCIYKPTKKSKYMHSLLVHKENHTQTIQYTKAINGTASLVEAISIIKKEYKSTGHYRIQFVTCSCANVDRSEREKMMVNQRQRLISRPKGLQSTNKRFQEMQSKVE